MLLPLGALFACILPIYTIILKKNLEAEWDTILENEFEGNFEHSNFDSKVFDLYEKIRVFINNGGRFNNEEERAKENEKRKEYYKYTGFSRLANDYELLKVSKDSSNDEIRKAFANEIKKWHPDVCKKNGIPIEVGKEHTQKIVQAYKNIRAQRGF